MNAATEGSAWALAIEITRTAGSLRRARTIGRCEDVVDEGKLGIAGVSRGALEAQGQLCETEACEVPSLQQVP